MLRGAVCSLTLLLACSHAGAQAPQYDIVSVRPHDPSDPTGTYQATPQGIIAHAISLRGLIANAYNVKMWLVNGLPGWAMSSYWDVEAKMTEPPTHPLTKEERATMLQGLLRQRFGLVAHTENRMLPVLEMTVIPNAPPLKPALMNPPSDDSSPARPKNGYRMGNGTLEGSISMASLVLNLSFPFEKTVVDKTNLTGYYDVKLRWTEGMSTTDNGTSDTPPALMEALQQQLGLKLTPSKAELPVIVVDSVQQPEAN